MQPGGPIARRSGPLRIGGISFESRAACVNREKLIQEILAPLGAFSAHLDLSAQGLFAIGYYHQTRDFYTKREDTDAG